MTEFPRAVGLPDAMAALVCQLADLWANDPLRPRPNSETSAHWDALIEAWICDRTMPLFVRRSSRNRGSVLAHPEGRELIPADNSPAQWAFALAVLGQVPALDDIRVDLDEDRIPIAMMLGPEERATAQRRCTLSKVVNPNRYGWKVAHIEPVGMGTSVPVAAVPLQSLEEHFRKLMSPGNMFAIPLRYSGLGELPEFCEAMRRHGTSGP